MCVVVMCGSLVIVVVGRLFVVVGDVRGCPLFVAVVCYG